MKGLCVLLWLGFAMFFNAHDAVAQTSVIAHLRSALSNNSPGSGNPPDTAGVHTLNLLARAFYGINADSAFFYSRMALDHAEKIHYERGQAESWRMIGNTCEMIGDYPYMLFSYHRSKAIAQKIGNAGLVAMVNVNIALYYKQMGEYDEALQQMGTTIPIYNNNGDSLECAYVRSHFSDIAFQQGKLDSALHYARQAAGIVAAMKDTLSMASFNNDIGRILTAMRDYQGALGYHMQSMEYYQRIDDRLGKTETAGLLANTWLQRKDYARALEYARQSLVMAREIHRKRESRDAGKILSEIYAATGDYRNALLYARLYKDFSDSLFNEQARKQIFGIEARNEYKRKEDSLGTASAKKDLLQRGIDRTHWLQILTAILVIIFLSILTFFLLRSRAAGRQSNQLLQVKNAEIGRQKEEMEHQAVQLLLNNQQKDKLFSIIAHDLRGPLNSLKGVMDFMKEKTLSEQEISGMMAELRRNVDYSSELVGNLLFWASSQLNGIVVTPVTLHLYQLTETILHLFVKQAREKGITLRNDLEPMLQGYADKDMTQVVIRNLVSNAIKFCRSGDTITVSGRPTGSHIEICVADTGIGIKKDVLEKIQRKESVTTYGTAKEKGTGLGMLLCREFTEENRGQFRIESEWEKGSRCYFTMPVPASSSSINV